MPHNLKCKRYLEAEGRKCGMPALRRKVRKQHIGTFCFPCWLEVMPTLPLSYYGFAGPLNPMQESQAWKAVYKQIESLRSEWERLLAEEEAKYAAG